MPAKVDIEIVKDRLRSLFPNYKFDFSNYINTHSKIDVVCDKGHKTQPVVKNLSKGHGCRICSYDTIASKQTKSKISLIDEFRNIHGDRYDYSKFNYIRNRIPSTIICPEHGEFEQSATSHLRGNGCPSCSGNRRLTNIDFVKKAKEIHTIPYNYELVEYENSHKKVKILCPKHGEFEQTPNSHLSGKGCPKCKQSVGENLIERFLIRNNINYIPQKKFSNCRYINVLLFDFYLPDYNTCIEFNGIQHYKPIEVFGGQEAYELNVKRDIIKKSFCDEQGIKLIVIKQDRKHIDTSDVLEQIENIKSILKIEEKILHFNCFIKKYKN